jgi:hypothetical protein
MKRKLLAVLGLAGVLALAGACSSEQPATLPLPDTSGMTLVDAELPNVPSLPSDENDENFEESADWLDDWNEFIVNMPLFGSVTGTIVEITSEQVHPDFDETVERVKITDADGMNTVLMVDFATAVLLDEGLAVGKEITGYFENLPFMIMIYPPQHTAIAIIEPFTATIDRFQLTDFFSENNLINSANDSVLVLDENVEIVFQDGTPFEGEIYELAGRKLVAYYTLVRRSLPSRIDPHKIVILFERAVHPIHHFTPEELDGFDFFDGDDSFFDSDASMMLQLTPEELAGFWTSLIDPETVQIVVDDVVIDAPTPFVNLETGSIMLPVAAIAEAMGVNVVGEGADVVIGAGMLFTVGVDSYFIGRMAPIELGTAPELVDGILFVPELFFQVMLQSDVYLMDGDVWVRSSVD